MDAVSDQQAADLGRVPFVPPSGNHRQDRLCTRLRLGQQTGWRLPSDDTTFNAIAIWGAPQAHPPRGDLQVALTTPGLAPATTHFTLPWQYSTLSGPDGVPLAWRGPITRRIRHMTGCDATASR
jgi:hypothetical protein